MLDCEISDGVGALPASAAAPAALIAPRASFALILTLWRVFRSASSISPGAKLAIVLRRIRLPGMEKLEGVDRVRLMLGSGLGLGLGLRLRFGRRLVLVLVFELGPGVVVLMNEGRLSG